MWSLALWLALFAVGGAAPRELDEIPAEVRNQATVVLTARYSQGRSACQFRADGSRVWYLESVFNVQTVLRGKVEPREILLNHAALPKSDYVASEWEQDGTYLLLLRPSEASASILEDPEGLFNFRTAMEKDEIVAVVRIASPSPR